MIKLRSFINWGTTVLLKPRGSRMPWIQGSPHTTTKSSSDFTLSSFQTLSPGIHEDGPNKTALMAKHFLPACSWYGNRYLILRPQELKLNTVRQLAWNKEMNSGLQCWGPCIANSRNLRTNTEFTFSPVGARCLVCTLLLHLHGHQ